MMLPSLSQSRPGAVLALCYVLASMALAGLYWGMFCFLDGLPCREFLCNLDWLIAFFGPVVIISVLTPLGNYGLLLWERGKPAPLWPMLRLFLSAIGSGFSILMLCALAGQLIEDGGLGSFDLSPQDLTIALAFLGLTWLNLQGARSILRKAHP